MSYVIPYEATYECPKGHNFVASANPLKPGSEKPRCPICLEEWISAHVPNGEQISEARQRADRVTEF